MLISKIIKKLIVYIEQNGDSDAKIVGMDKYGYAKEFDDFKLKEYSIKHKTLTGVSGE